MAARSTLSSAERRQLHSNIATLRDNGWTLRQLALELGLSVAALSNMLRSKDRGTSSERAAKLEKLVATNAKPRSTTRRRAPTRKGARAANGTSTGRHRRSAKGTRRRGSRIAATGTSSGRTRIRRPRGLAADMLSDAEAKRFVREVRAAMASGLRLSDAAGALGYSRPASLSAALKRVRIPRDVADRFKDLPSAVAKGEGPRSASTTDKPARRRRARKRLRKSARNARRETSARHDDQDALLASPADAVSRSAQSGAAIEDGGATLAAAATIYSERVSPVPAISAAADVERRQRFMEQLDAARTHLARAHDSLQATIESGAATVVTQPGVQRILDMLQHLRDELAAS